MEEINAVLLAGGQSSRFGVDKALISFSGQPLIEYIYNILAENFAEVIIVGSKEKYSFIEAAEIREDIYQDKGPLAGIYSGLYFSKSRYNFICGCDMPFLSENYFDFLKDILSKNLDKEIIVPEYKGYLEPLAAIYNSSLLDRIEAEIRSDNLEIKSFYNKSRIKVVKEEILKRKYNLDKLFFNLNYPEDQKRALFYLNDKEVKDFEKAESERIY